VADTLHLEWKGSPVDLRIIRPEELRSGAIVLPEPWMVRRFMEHPDEIRNLSRREFQVFTAELLDRKGYKVTMGPLGRDGGVDVRAERGTEFGPELVLVQAKHPDPGNKVGLDTVKLLHYQVIQEGATRGLVMTDSTFSRGAIQLIEACRYRMDGADGARIRHWLEALRTGGPPGDGKP
jgi:restriction endonuclease Mrr